jgi:hypothetical protein
LISTKSPTVLRPALMSFTAMTMQIVRPAVKMTAWPALSQASDV